jgi:uncharacterized protein YecE (DUF72 family)
MRSADYLAFYAEHFYTVEVDSTFYGCPSARTVNNWGARTPEGFIFSVKVPQVITHEKVLADCEADLKEFLDTMSILGPKLGPIVFQFPFFNRNIFRDRHEFLDRLVPFLTKQPNPQRLYLSAAPMSWCCKTNECNRIQRDNARKNTGMTRLGIRPRTSQ